MLSPHNCIYGVFCNRYPASQILYPAGVPDIKKGRIIRPDTVPVAPLQGNRIFIHGFLFSVII
jgi:hypothetical protein